MLNATSSKLIFNGRSLPLSTNYNFNKLKSTPLSVKNFPYNDITTNKSRSFSFKTFPSSIKTNTTISAPSRVQDTESPLVKSIVRLFRTLSNPNTGRTSIPLKSFAGITSKGSFAKEFRRLISTEGSTSRSPPVLTPAQQAHLDQLHKEAMEAPSDSSKQAAYVQELGRLGNHGAVIAHCTNPAYASDESVKREYVKSLVFMGIFDSQPFSSLFSTPSSSTSTRSFIPGSSPEQPLFTSPAKTEEKWVQWLRIAYYLVSFLLAAAVIYFFLSSSGTRSGGLGELMNNNINAADMSVTTTFKDVKGSDEAKEELSDLVEYLKNPNKFAHMGAKLPKGVLLVGPPGCGKTLLAKALAGEAGVPFYYTSGSEFEEMLVGVGARRVRSLFNKAKESAPCIIFIDEIDAVGSKRDAMDTRSSKMSLNQLLVEMDGFSPSAGVIVIAATNMPDSLDPALTRPGRFDRQVTIDLPDVKARKEILGMYLNNKQAGDVDLESLAKATVGFSGADLFNMVNTALIQAVKKNMFKVTNAVLIASKETVQMGPERKSMVITPETKNITAYHEAGHALISLLYKKPIVKATLVPRGHALGMVSYLPKDEMLTKKEDLLNQLDTAMGGRIAEELVFGPDKVTQGAGSDFRQATRIAYTMVASYGMSDKLGHFSFNESELRNLSTDTRALIDQEVKNILEASYERAKKILVSHRTQLSSLAQALLDYETLTEEEVRMAFEGKSLKAHKEARRKEEESITTPPPVHRPSIDVPVPNGKVINLQ